MKDEDWFRRIMPVPKYTGKDGRSYETMEEKWKADEEWFRINFPKQLIPRREENSKHPTIDELTRFKYIPPKPKPVDLKFLLYKPNEESILSKGMNDSFISPKLPSFDYREELGRKVLELRLAEIKPPSSTFIKRPEEEAREAKNYLDSRLAQVSIAERDFKEDLEIARKSRRISFEDYLKASSEMLGHFSPFERLRREARDDYGEKVKFCLGF